MSAGKLIIICGLPGSGKTTLAKKLAKEQNAIRFCPDEWMEDLDIDLYDEDTRYKLEQLQWKIAQDVLKLGGITIIEWGTYAREERDVLREDARKIGVQAELYYLSESLDVLHARILMRGKENPPISYEMLKEWSKIFQTPTEDEIALYDAYYQ